MHIWLTSDGGTVIISVRQKRNQIKMRQIKWLRPNAWNIDAYVCIFFNCVALNPLIDLLKRKKSKLFHRLNTVET